MRGAAPLTGAGTGFRPARPDAMVRGVALPAMRHAPLIAARNL